MQKVTVGRTVLYRMTAGDCDQLKEPPGQNNEHQAGQLVPAVVVRVWSEDAGTSNLRVSVDGNATLWKTSISEGGELGHWQWPEREPAAEPAAGAELLEVLKQLNELQESVAHAFRERDEQNEAVRHFRALERGTDTTGEAPPAGERALLPGQIG